MPEERSFPISSVIRSCSQIISKINICLPLVKKRDKQDFKKLRKKTKKIQKHLIQEMKKCQI